MYRYVEVRTRPYIRKMLQLRACLERLSRVLRLVGSKGGGCGGGVRACVCSRDVRLSWSVMMMTETLWLRAWGYVGSSEEIEL